MSWLDLVLCRFVPVCLAVITHRFYANNTTVWVVEWDKFETILKWLPSGDPTMHCVFIKKKNRGGLGKLMQHFFRNKESTLTWFSRFIWKVFPFKSYSFFQFFLSVYKCRKSVSKTTLISLNWEIMVPTMPRYSTCGAVSTIILQEI